MGEGKWIRGMGGLVRGWVGVGHCFGLWFLQKAQMHTRVCVRAHPLTCERVCVCVCVCVCARAYRAHIFRYETYARQCASSKEARLGYKEWCQQEMYTPSLHKPYSPPPTHTHPPLPLSMSTTTVQLKQSAHGKACRSLSCCRSLCQRNCLS